MTATQHATSADGTSIAYEVSGSGPTLILVDAAGGFRGFGPMPELAGHLSADFTVVTFDRRGRGESGDTAPYAVEREVDDMRALIEAVGGRAFVHGFSSGAVLAMHAAASGARIDGLTLLEPPVEFDERPANEPDLGAEIAGLVAAGRRGDAYLHFNRSIGVPEEYIEGMRSLPVWPKLEALAHTLVYDTIVTSSFAREHLAAIPVPALAISSAATDERLTAWAAAVADGLPKGGHRVLEGEWHGVPAVALAATLRSFFSEVAVAASA